MVNSMSVETFRKLPYEVNQLLLSGVYHLCKTPEFDGYLILTPSGSAIHVNSEGECIKKIDASSIKDSEKTFL